MREVKLGRPTDESIASAVGPPDTGRRAVHRRRPGTFTVGVGALHQLRRGTVAAPSDRVAARAAGFVVLATLARPLGGWLADRRPPHHLVVGALAVVAVGAVVAAFEPHIAVSTVAFLAIAFALGLGNGAIFALVGQRVPASQVGSVTGVVGAAGGLGGFLPPIVRASSTRSPGTTRSA